MDPLDRADALLSRAQARGAFVVTPENATSPMDAASTMQIARDVVAEAAEDEDDEQTQHHLADATPTKELPGSGKDVPTDADSATQSGADEPEADEVEVEEDGLLPTTTQRMRSNVARRLDG